MCSPAVQLHRICSKSVLLFFFTGAYIRGAQDRLQVGKPEWAKPLQKVQAFFQPGRMSVFIEADSRQGQIERRFADTQSLIKLDSRDRLQCRQPVSQKTVRIRVAVREPPSRSWERPDADSNLAVMGGGEVRGKVAASLFKFLYMFQDGQSAA